MLFAFEYGVPIVRGSASDSERAIDGTKGHPIKMEIRASLHLTGPSPLLGWISGVNQPF